MTHLRGDEQTLLVAGHQDFCPPLLQVLTYGRVQEEDDDLFDDPLGARGRGVALKSLGIETGARDFFGKTVPANAVGAGR